MRFMKTVVEKAVRLFKEGADVLATAKG
jgi:hypothetical protein